MVVILADHADKAQGCRPLSPPLAWRFARRVDGVRVGVGDGGVIGVEIGVIVGKIVFARPAAFLGLLARSSA